MGQGQPETQKGGKKDDNKVVLKVDMDCEACRQRVDKILKKLPGVETTEFDMNAQMVTVKGSVNAYKAYEALRKKCGKRTMLVYPVYSKEDEKRAKEDAVISSVNKIVEQITDLFEPKPPDTTVELKVPMHCGACAKKIKRLLLRMDGVTEVEEDQSSDKVVVKGRALNADDVCAWVRDSGKHCVVVSVKKQEEKKAEGKGKKEEKPEGKTEKKDEAQQGKKNGGGKKGGKNGEKKDEKKQESKAEDEKKEEGKSEGKNEGKQEAKPEGKKETKKPSSDEGQEEAGDVDVRKYAYMPYQSRPEYVYPPQIFSDENPNACTLM